MAEGEDGTYYIAVRRGSRPAMIRYSGKPFGPYSNFHEPVCPLTDVIKGWVNDRYRRYTLKTVVERVEIIEKQVWPKQVV